jgi:hypothetical protein
LDQSLLTGNKNSTNKTEEGKSEKDPSSSEESRNIPFNFNQPAYLMVEGIGVNGSFNVSGAVKISGSSVTVIATGKTPASNFGDVTFSGRAQLFVDGQATSTQILTLPSSYCYATGTYPMGSASFTLPANGNAQIRINAGYVFQGDEGRAMPIPTLLSKTINITLYKGSNR